MLGQAGTQVGLTPGPEVSTRRQRCTHGNASVLSTAALPSGHGVLSQQPLQSGPYTGRKPLKGVTLCVCCTRVPVCAGQRLCVLTAVTR